jgi:hypothetical protein
MRCSDAQTVEGAAYQGAEIYFIQCQKYVSGSERSEKDGPVLGRGKKLPDDYISRINPAWSVSPWTAAEHGKGASDKGGEPLYFSRDPLNATLSRIRAAGSRLLSITVRPLRAYSRFDKNVLGSEKNHFRSAGIKFAGLLKLGCAIVGRFSGGWLAIKYRKEPQNPRR